MTAAVAAERIPPHPPTALVTGGSGGVGRAACLNLARRGYRVAFTYHANAAAAQALVAEVEAAGGSAQAHQVDLNDAARVADTVATVVRDFGGLDTVIHAAGPYVPQRYVSALTAEQFTEHVHTELIGFFNLVSASLPHLRSRQGSLVAVTSFAVRKFPPRDALSSVPKGGIEALVRAVAVEEGKYGVRANSVGPGALADGMTHRIRATGDISYELIEKVIPTIPLRRLGTAEEVATVVCFLASPEAAYVTGQHIDVDGGFQL
jgi:3-oxoacyl-[acyl-carrier protein] reductase